MQKLSKEVQVLTALRDISGVPQIIGIQAHCEKPLAIYMSLVEGVSLQTLFCEYIPRITFDTAFVLLKKVGTPHVPEMHTKTCLYPLDLGHHRTDS